MGNALRGMPPLANATVKMKAIKQKWNKQKWSKQNLLISANQGELVLLLWTDFLVFESFQNVTI